MPPELSGVEPLRPPHTMSSDPVHVAAWEWRAPGALRVEPVVQEGASILPKDTRPWRSNDGSEAVAETTVRPPGSPGATSPATG